MQLSKNLNKGFKHIMTNWKSCSQGGRSKKLNNKGVFLSKFKLEINKFCVVRDYANMGVLLSLALEVEKVLGKLGETFYELLKDEQDELLSTRENIVDKHVQVLNESLVNLLKR